MSGAIHPVVGSAIALGGGTLLTVGAINAQAKISSETNSLTYAADDLDAYFAPHGLGPRTGEMRERIQDYDATRDRWARAGYVMATTGGIGLAGGVGALALGGSSGRVAAGIGAMAAAVSGIAGLATAQHFMQVDDRLHDVEVAGMRAAEGGMADLASLVRADADGVGANHLASGPREAPTSG